MRRARARARARASRLAAAADEVREAVKNDDANQLRTLVERGHPTCKPDSIGKVAIHHAISKKSKNCFDILIKARDFDVNIQDKMGATPLSSVCSLQEAPPHVEEMFNALIQHPDMNPRTLSLDGKTALHKAAFNGHFGFVEALVGLGLHPCEIDLVGNTPLHLALSGPSCPEKKRKMAAFLIQHGASVWTKNKRSETAIELCVKYPEISVDIVESVPEERRREYLENGKDRCAPLLVLATRFSNHPLVEILLDLGIDFGEGHYVSNFLCWLIDHNAPKEILRKTYELGDPYATGPGQLCVPQRVAVQRYIDKGMLEESLLWFFINEYDDFYILPYQIPAHLFLALYESWTVLSQFFATTNNLHGMDFIKHMLSKPKCAISEDTTLSTLEVIPPLVAVGMNSVMFLDVLDILKNHGAKVRTRHCYAILWRRDLSVIRTYIEKEIFYLDDLFEDDLSVLRAMMKSIHNLRHLPQTLKLLLTLRLDHSPISPSKVRQLRQLLEETGPAFRVLQDVLEGCRNQKVPKLMNMARLIIKGQFDFVEDDCKQYLEERNCPATTINFVLKGNYPILDKITLANVTIAEERPPQLRRINMICNNSNVPIVFMSDQSG